MLLLLLSCSIKSQNDAAAASEVTRSGRVGSLLPMRFAQEKYPSPNVEPEKGSSNDCCP